MVVEDGEPEEVRVHGRLPHMDIDITYRRAREGDAAFIGINIRATSMSQGFERLVMMTNPFSFWAQVAEAAWRPWLQGLQAISSQTAPARRLPPPADD